MKPGQIRKDQIMPFLAQIDASDLQWRADTLEPRVPGISGRIRADLDELKAAIRSQDYGYALQSRVSVIASRLDYAEKGLYSHCDGRVWHYATS